MEENIYLSTFGKHVPRILKHQIISKLVNQYVQDHGVPCVKVVDSSKDVDGDASIVRFHCSMLFVDISGFTVLSQRLKVDELKEKINNYFELIVSIILKYDGEIIKFAGDAIFVVFQTKVNSTGKFLFLAVCVHFSGLLCLTRFLCSFHSRGRRLRCCLQGGGGHRRSVRQRGARQVWPLPCGAEQGRLQRLHRRIGRFPWLVWF
jgi:class 3 adenylate cyclase